MEFNWEDFKNNKITVRCKTEKEAKKFIKQCYKHGLKWRYGSENNTFWEDVNEKIYYECDGVYIYYLDWKSNEITVVEYKEDNKMELKEGMIIECRNGERYLLRKVNDELIGSNFDGWIKAIYNENLCENHYHNETFDIMKIYISKSLKLENLFDNLCLKCIWERKEPKKMTLAQISEALGYEVEVIDNMSDYKFKVGDKVKILKMDEWSNGSMVNDISRIGIIVDRSDDEGINGYLVDLGDKYICGFWYMENSLELVESKDDYNEELISKDDVLSILYETKESGVINYGTICNLIRRVRELPCK